MDAEHQKLEILQTRQQEEQRENLQTVLFISNLRWLVLPILFLEQMLLARLQKQHLIALMHKGKMLGFQRLNGIPVLNRQQQSGQ